MTSGDDAVRIAGDGGRGKAGSALDWQAPASAYRHSILISSLFFWLAVTAILGPSLGFAFSDRRVLLAALLLPLAVGIVTTAYQRAAVLRRAHALGERALFYRSGLWWRRETAIPYARIQHVARAQGPVDRIFDLASLQIYTAGAAQADLTIPGLTAADSRLMEETLLARVEDAGAPSLSQERSP